MSGPDQLLHEGTEAGRAGDAGSGRRPDVAVEKARAPLRPWGPFRATTCSSE